MGEEEYAKNAVLKCSEGQRCRRRAVSSKWLSVGENVSYTRAVMCCNITELSGSGNFVYKIGCNWEGRIRSLVLGVEDDRLKLL